jgi:asparagine synthetase B (glutamine-hydrolysing)
MSDFILTSSKPKEGLLSGCIEKYGFDNKKPVKEISYGWLKIAYKENHYNGFGTYETDKYFCLVVGGPVLNFCDNCFISSDKSNEGTKRIFKRWVFDNKIIWDEDLSGPFVVLLIDKIERKVSVITDMMSFIPVYQKKISSGLSIGTHLDSLVSAFGGELDQVSMLDYITNEVVTFPHTMFKEFVQLYPGSNYEWANDFSELKNVYWIPEEAKETSVKKDELSERLYNALKGFVKKVTDSSDLYLSFVSGGEDSRLVLSLLPRKEKLKAILFLDRVNEEYKVAKKVCDILGIDIKLYKRSKSYYWDIFRGASDLVGIGFDYAHVHTYGFVHRCQLDQYDAVFGGFLADTLLKGHHIRKKRIPSFISFLPIPDRTSNSKDSHVSEHNSIYNEAVLSRVKKRREAHERWVKEMRVHSFREWSKLYPASMHNDIPNINGNRRLFKSFEPFTSNEVVKIAAIASSHQKLNRRLFHSSFKRIYKKTKFIKHTNGSYPYMPWFVNNIFKFIASVKKKILNHIIGERSNSGSWVDWSTIIKSDKAKELEEKFIPSILNEEQNIFTINLRDGVVCSDSISTRQKRLILQLGYRLDRIRNEDY